MNAPFWQSVIIGMLIGFPLSSALVATIWWFTFRTLGWPFNWRAWYAPAYWRWVARTYWPGRHELAAYNVCVCGRWRCRQMRRLTS